MNPTSLCPEKAQLERLLRGECSPIEAQSYFQHARSCARCTAFLAGKPYPGQDEQTKGQDDPPAEPMPAEPMTWSVSPSFPGPGGVGTGPRGFHEADTAMPAEPDDSDVLALLSPPQGEGELGRLGSYRILKILGRGGMGTVLEAEDPDLNRRLAIKVMNPDLARSKDYRRRFLREAQAAASLSHDNIVPIFQVGEANGAPFLVMPLLPGLTLAGLLNRKRQALDIQQAVRIGREIAQGLAAAHARGLVHRDIKPGNIWLELRERLPGKGPGGEDLRVRILDFGLARPVDPTDEPLTQPGVSLGTPHYMAPEQALCHPVDHRADLFSLGAVLYEATTWKRAKVHPRNPLVSPQELRPDMPDLLSYLITRLLSWDPHDRPDSAQEVVEILQGLEAPAREEKTMIGRRGSVTDQFAVVREPDARFPRWILLVLAVLFLLGAAQAVYYFTRPPEQEDPVAVGKLPPDKEGTPKKETGPPEVKDVGKEVKVPPGDISKKEDKDPKIDPKKDGDKKDDKAPDKVVPKDDSKDKTKDPRKDDVKDRDKKTEKPPPTTRSVLVRTTPPGAAVYLAGKKLDQATPAKFELPLGPITLKVATDKRFKVVPLKPGETELEVFLATRPLRIETIPPQAVVRVNGEEVGKTNGVFEVPDEPFDLELVGPKEYVGIVTHAARIVPKAGLEKLEHHFRRELFLSSVPTGATVHVDGVKAKQTTDGIFQVPVGTFSLLLEAPGRREKVEVDGTKLDFKTTPEGKALAALHIVLPQLRFLVELKTNPAGAAIKLEEEKGKFLKALSPDKLELLPGKYAIEIAKKGFRPYKGFLEVKEGKTDYSFTLKEEGPGVRHALLVGVHDYGEKAPAFLHAESDAETLGDLLRVGGYAKVAVLTQSRGKDEQPTAETLRARLRAFTAEMNPEDSIWVGWFGRIIVVEDGNYFWTAGGDPSRAATLLPMEEVLKELRDCPARTKVLVLDGWRHGPGKESPLLAGRAFRPAPADLDGILLLCGCQPGRKSFTEPLEHHGIFGRALKWALAGNADADKDERLTAAELGAFLQKEVQERARESHGEEQVATMDAHGLSPDSLTVVPMTKGLKHFGLGLTALYKEETAAARDQFSRALEANNDFVEAYVLRAEAHLHDKDHKEAARDAEEALKRNPHHALAWSYQGEAHAKLKGPKEAHASFQKAIDLEPTLAMGYRNLGRMYFNEGDAAAALPHLLKATDHEPVPYLAWYDLGRALVKLGNFEAAVESYTAYLKGCPTDERHLTIGHQLRADALRKRAAKAGEIMRLRYLEMAREDYDALTRLHPKKAEYWNMRGTLSATMGKNKEAAADFEKAGEVDETFADAFYNLGVVRKKMKEYTAAIEAQKKAVAAAKDMRFPEAHAELFAAYTLRSRTPDAQPDDAAEAARHRKLAMEQGYKF